MNLKKVPDLDYEEQQHGPVFNFLYSIKTHFTTLMSVNILFVIFNIPMMLIAFALTLMVLPTLNPVFIPENFAQFMLDSGVVGNQVMNDVGTEAAYQVYYLIVVFCVMFLMGTTLTVIGPFQAGFSQIYRNLYRQESVFIFNDFKDGMKSNLKQSLIAGLIGVVFTAVDMLAVSFYAGLGSRFGTAASTFFVVLFFVFIIVQNMVYTMIVSRELSLKNIYKNAFLFVLLKFGPCFAMALVMIVFYIVIPAALMLTTTFFAYAVVVLYYLTVVFALIQYLMAFFTGEVIKEYIEPMSPTPVYDDDDFADLNEGTEGDEESDDLDSEENSTEN
ncbi:MAG: hypothetical protein MJ094_08045 [Saccharofermentans sp.]|nr:hypothetical protein [Saccharofermentans sp.]